ncbi:NAD(P)/FAD-dependent oxidoreductase [Paenibacillus sp. GCM10027629]|uniref:NAD(P)/FAD-dependent oxidoreductase n=1 Tax=Paenibacillus sp. GCM10027629 TaxID=3273414 RepID=UPI00363C3CEC
MKDTNVLMDVVIVGGGPAGLSAALLLGRSCRLVVVIDEGKARNSVTYESHGYLTRDGVKPSDFKEIAIAQMKAYTNVHIEQDVVEQVQQEQGIFRTLTRGGHTFSSKKIIFATGMKDHLPPIPGLTEVYGTSVFPCPYCDGWERRNEPLAVIGNDERLFHFVKTIYSWSKDLIVLTNGPSTITREERREMEAHHIQMIETEILAMKSNEGKLDEIVFIDGQSIPCKGGFLLDTGAKQATLIPSTMGIPMNETGGYVTTSDYGHTAIEGVYIIGDAKNCFTGVIGAAREGYYIGELMNKDLIEEEWDAHRTHANRHPGLS